MNQRMKGNIGIVSVHSCRRDKSFLPCLRILREISTDLEKLCNFGQYWIEIGPALTHTREPHSGLA